MARLFTLAYPAFAPAVQARIEALRAQHDPQHGLLAAHVTLEFGQANQPQADYTAAVQGLARQHPGFAVRLAGVQHWPGPDGAHYLFFTLLEGAAELQRLQTALAHCLALPAPPQDCPPHITVGRYASQAAAWAALAGCQAGVAGLTGATGPIQTLVVGALHGASFTHLLHCPLGA